MRGKWGIAHHRMLSTGFPRNGRPELEGRGESWFWSSNGLGGLAEGGVHGSEAQGGRATCGEVVLCQSAERRPVLSASSSRW